MPIKPELLSQIRQLAQYQAVLVTGPQRSGTTLMAHIIAQEAGLEYRDEESFGVHDCDRFDKLLSTESKIVVQCPGMSRWIHHYYQGQRCVVFMLRDAEQVRASAKRIDWNSQPEIDKYKSARFNGGKATVMLDNLAELTWFYWDMVQKPECQHWLEVHFDSLRDHKLFVPDSQRVSFEPRQWRVK